MRALHECTAEVFRRSQRKIKQRRQRIIGILLCCIPLAVCLMLLPRGNSKDERPLAELAENPSPTVVQIEISGTNGSYTLRQYDANKLLRIIEGYSVMNSITDSGLGELVLEAAPECGSPRDETETETMEVADEDEPKYHETDTGYTLIITMDDGTKVCYYLLENTVTDLETGNVTILTRQQAQELRDLIEEKEESQ